MRGQVSLEFLYAVVFSLLFFAMTLTVYLQSQQDANEIYQSASLERVCIAIASQVSAVSAAGDGASAGIVTPNLNFAQDYKTYVNGPNSTVSVNSGTRVRSCRITTTLVSNGTSDAFIATNMTKISNRQGTVYFEGG